MEEEGKNRKRKWWEIEIKMLFFGIVSVIKKYSVFLLVFLFCQLYFTISQNYFLSLLNVKVT
jgi:asparagine N-glycosylation enzyme membrane subunit Stt3